MKNKVLLIDGSSLIFRAFFALIRRPLRNSKGENTSAIYGFLHMFFKLIEEQKPDFLGIAFDVSRKDLHRTKLYPLYKANRVEVDPELKEQIPIIINIVEKMNIPVYMKSGFEADDFLGSLAKALESNKDVFICTGDKDLLQLVNDHVSVITMHKGVSETQTLDPDLVKETKGIKPSQIIDYLAIMGDSSDNIPGVKGIGEKGAVSLLNEFENLENIYENLDKIKGAKQKYLINSKENAFLSQKLATIDTNIPCDISKILDKNYDLKDLINKDVLEILNEKEISNIKQKSKKEENDLFSKKTDLLEKENLTKLDGNYHLITSKKELLSLKDEILKHKFCSMDFETTDINELKARIIGISFSFEEKKACYIPLLHTDCQTEWKTDDELLLLLEFKDIFEDESIQKIGQNLKYEYKVLKKYNITLKGIYFDTMIAAHLINSSQTHYNLDHLAEIYLNYQTIAYSEIVLEPKTKTLLDYPIEKVLLYAAEDSDITFRLYKVFQPLLSEKNLDNAFYNIEIPLLSILGDMEAKGFLLDIDLLENLKKIFSEKLKTLKEQIYQLAEEEFNINSPKQLGHILYEKLNLPVSKKTSKDKNPSTDEASLLFLSDYHPLPSLLLEYKSIYKLKTTYVDALPKDLDENMRIHTTFNQTITQTGRLSSSNPNLQNIPIKNELGKEIRGAFITKKNHLLISSDYSQIELRLFAHFTKDQKMIEAFKDKRDIHKETASLVYQIPQDEVTESQRRMAKIINYGISYGMSAFRLSKELKIPISEAQNFIKNYFDSFPNIEIFMKKVLQDAQTNGYVSTFSGRRRDTTDLLGKETKSIFHLNHSERYAINTVIQGSAADLIKMAMIDIDRTICKKYETLDMLLQVHDELIFEVHQDQAKDALLEIKEHMQNIIDLSVPLEVDIHSGFSWKEIH